jgi:hypothetical protein
LKNEEKNIKIAQFLKNAFLAVKLQSTKLEKRLSKGGGLCVELSLRGIALAWNCSIFEKCIFSSQITVD